MKKAFSILLALVMVFSLAVPALAADSTNSVPQGSSSYCIYCGFGPMTKESDGDDLIVTVYKPHGCAATDDTVWADGTHAPHNHYLYYRVAYYICGECGQISEVRAAKAYKEQCQVALSIPGEIS